MTADAPEEDQFSAAAWDERYRGAERVWSGNPNVRLVEFATDLEPGSALDVGSGEGADTIWLARRGWRVTAVDVSQVGLDKAARHAADQSEGIAERIRWVQADLREWQGGDERYELVSAQFMHLPHPEIDELQRRLAAVVAPGGTLLIVGHDLSDVDSTVHRAHLPIFYTAAEVAAHLEPGEWDVSTAESLSREVTGRTASRPPSAMPSCAPGGVESRAARPVWTHAFEATPARGLSLATARRLLLTAPSTSKV